MAKLPNVIVPLLLAVSDTHRDTTTGISISLTCAFLMSFMFTTTISSCRGMDTSWDLLTRPSVLPTAYLEITYRLAFPSVIQDDGGDECPIHLSRLLLFPLYCNTSRGLFLFPLLSSLYKFHLQPEVHVKEESHAKRSEDPGPLNRNQLLASSQGKTRKEERENLPSQWLPSNKQLFSIVKYKALI